MEYYVKSVIPVIESNYDSFTSVEKSIADFFIHNCEKMDFSAKSVAERLYVSEASLSRFSKKCGYRGYREFIYQYEETFVEKQESITRNTRMVLNAYQELINKTYSMIDEVQVARIARLLGRAERVFVCGMGSSGVASEEMEMRFMRVGVNIQAVKDIDLMRMQSVFQNERSLIVGISLSGERKGVRYLMQESHKKGAKTVFITTRSRNEFHEFCDEQLLVPSLKNLNHGNLISPQFPILVMLDIIYSCYVELDKYKMEAYHEDTLHALGGEKEK